MSVTIGGSSLKKRTVGNTNIKDIYDGNEHIWPTAVINFSDFTSVQLRYIWGTRDGRDFDTGSCYINSPISSLNYRYCGWSHGNAIPPYFYWGGDNTASGAECVMFNVEQFEKEGLSNKMPDELTMELLGNWYGERYNGKVTIECTAYKGGVIVRGYQVNNLENDKDTRGIYLFPIADGTIKMPSKFVPNQYIDCYFGEYVRITRRTDSVSTYARVNMVDDTVMGHPNIKIRRYYTGATIEDGWFYYNNSPLTKYKVWNNQVNINGQIIQLGVQSLFTGDDGVNFYTLYIGMLTDINEIYDTSYDKGYTFQFGFVAGNSEFRGQQTGQCVVRSNNKIAAREFIGNITYANTTKIGRLTIANPIVT